jgi:hypothetical protein
MTATVAQQIDASRRPKAIFRNISARHRGTRPSSKAAADHLSY